MRENARLCAAYHTDEQFFARKIRDFFPPDGLDVFFSFATIANKIIVTCNNEDTCM